MLAGTGSDVGKSLICAGLCRVFLQDGYSPAPFKAQNMALNSYVTPDGLEIGRAQATQAEAAGIPCDVDMNPLLLKPTTDCQAQMVLLGRPAGNRSAYSYFSKEGRGELRKVVNDAFRRLSEKYNPIVMEGAGSISEINLRDTDLVNMPMARSAGADVILVADIDRGGVFASAYGSIMLQLPEDKGRIKGIIINKFRGDIRLFEEGRRMMEEICGVPVLGVVPMMRDIYIEEEDSLSLEMKRHRPEAGKINVAVALLRHTSNFTDFDALERDPRVNVYYAATPDDIAKADIIMLPGSKSTVADLNELRRSGMAAAIVKGAREGKTVAGICGGYQMMGMSVSDPDGEEGDIRELPGLGLLPVSTILTGSKRTVRSEFTLVGDDSICQGYEIHQGVTTPLGGVLPLHRMSDGTPEGCQASPRCFGTYMHGWLDNGAVRDMLLRPFTDQRGENFDFGKFKESQYDLLADRLREYIDMEKLYKIMGRDD